jgi:Sec-independent protein secretion pathway component TatC
MRAYFSTLQNWRIDVWVCLTIAALVTPADPYSMFLVFIPLASIWMTIRWVIAGRLAR